MDKIRQYKPKRFKAKNVFKSESNWNNLYKTREWTRYRFLFLKYNPNCYCCGAKASVVDHLKPHKGDVALFEDIKNHAPICETCHNTITGLFDKKSNAENADKMYDEKLK